MESMNPEKNRQKQLAGFDGGNMFLRPALAPAMTVVDGYPAEVDQMLMTTVKPTGKTEDPWVMRRANAKL